VDPIAENVTVLDDDVALMDADPQFDAPVRGNVVFWDPPQPSRLTRKDRRSTREPWSRGW
jgi:hypothetical protein